MHEYAGETLKRLEELYTGIRKKQLAIEQEDKEEPYSKLQETGFGC